MEREHAIRMETLICDLIRLTAQSHVKTCTYEEKMLQLNNQIAMLEENVGMLLQKDMEKSENLVPSSQT